MCVDLCLGVLLININQDQNRQSDQSRGVVGGAALRHEDGGRRDL